MTNLQPQTSNLKPTTSNPKPTTSNPKPTTSNLKPKTYNLKPQTSNPKPQTPNLQPKTQNLQPQTANLKPQTANRKSPVPAPQTPMPAFSKKPSAGARGRVAAHPRKPLVSETRGLRGWAATQVIPPTLRYPALTKLTSVHVSHMYWYDGTHYRIQYKIHRSTSTQ